MDKDGRNTLELDIAQAYIVDPQEAKARAPPLGIRERNARHAEVARRVIVCRGRAVGRFQRFVILAGRFSAALADRLPEAQTQASSAYATGNQQPHASVYLPAVIEDQRATLLQDRAVLLKQHDLQRTLLKKGIRPFGILLKHDALRKQIFPDAFVAPDDSCLSNHL